MIPTQPSPPFILSRAVLPRISNIHSGYHQAIAIFSTRSPQVGPLSLFWGSAKKVTVGKAPHRLSVAPRTYKPAPHRFKHHTTPTATTLRACLLFLCSIAPLTFFCSPCASINSFVSFIATRCSDLSRGVGYFGTRYVPRLPRLPRTI